MFSTLTNEPLTNYFPTDIIRYITPFTYKELSKDLLRDIQSFQITKEKIIGFYYEKYSYLFEYEKNADLNWVTSDILLFAKKQRLTTYKSMNRLYIKSFLINPKKYKRITVNMLFNKLWSKLTPDERNNFIFKIQNTKLLF